MQQIHLTLYSIWMLSNTLYMFGVDVGTIPCRSGASTNAPWHHPRIWPTPEFRNKQIWWKGHGGGGSIAYPQHVHALKTSYLFGVDVGTIPCRSGASTMHLDIIYVAQHVTWETANSPNLKRQNNVKGKWWWIYPVDVRTIPCGSGATTNALDIISHPRIWPRFP